MVGVVGALAAVFVIAVFGGSGDVDDDSSAEFGGMSMSAQQIGEMIKQSMGRRDLEKISVSAPKDREGPMPFKVVGGYKQFEFDARPVRWEYRDGQTVAAWGYNGEVPGPTIRVTEGDRVRMNFTNNLPAATTVHWHGVDVPSNQDGVPTISQKAIKPGERYSYEFVARPAGTRWYHTHGSEPGDEASQLDMGLAGPLIIDPKAKADVDVDKVLVLDEWAVESDGLNVAMMTGGGHQAHNAGFNVFTINGRAMPDFEPVKIKRGQKVRLRLINAGSSTIHPIHLHGHQFTITALDGNPVPLPARQKRNVITLATGETADIEFVAQNPGVWMLHCHELHHADGGMMTVVQYEGSKPAGEMHSGEQH